MNKCIFNKYPDSRSLLSKNLDVNSNILDVNGHFHTPFSFSSFTSIDQVFEMALEEKVRVLGINDFYTTDGYADFNQLAQQYKVFPLFNIEFMGLQKDLQAKGIRVNDPSNPGRTYFSGKGLRFPVKLNAQMVERLFRVQDESNQQTAEMIRKLNAWTKELGQDLNLNFDTIKAKYAKNLVRERHIAKALRESIVERFESADDQKSFYAKVFDGKELKSALTDVAGVENEIRSNLLKSGGKAFVPENDKAFLSLEQVMELIIHAGGIPCYPVLLDNPKGEFTDFEQDFEALYNYLVMKNIYSVELIPSRNNPAVLEEFVNFFNDRGFLVTLGTEHNTPQLDPLKVYDGKGNELSENLKRIAYEGACIIAAHQYLISKDEQGYLDAANKAKIEQRADFIALGNAVIHHFVN